VDGRTPGKAVEELVSDLLVLVGECAEQLGQPAR
jgi:hypothetical protein